MLTKQLSALCAGGCVLLLVLSGCFSMPWSRTGNQGGGTLVTATTKLASDNLGGLNPDEIQLLADAAMQFSQVEVPAVTDEQAAAVVTFFNDNNVTSFDSLEALIHQGEEDPESIVISDEVRAVIAQLIANIDQYRDLENVDVGDYQELADENGIGI